MKPRRAIFFDRDNTLNWDREGYIGDWRKIELMPHACEFVKNMKDAGYLLFLVTNQSGVGRGFFTLKEVNECNKKLMQLLGDEELFVEICNSIGTPEKPDDYRKPSPKFLLEMFKKYDLQAENCWVIGDRNTDIELAANAGCRAILVHNLEEKLSVAAEEACLGKFSDLKCAWRFIEEQHG